MKKNRAAGLASEWPRRTVKNTSYAAFVAISGLAKGLLQDDLTIVVIKRETLP